MKLYSDAELAQILDKDIFHLIGDAADELSLDCYVVGGYVRDIFLERPSNDIDVVVVGSGIKVADALRRAGAEFTLTADPALLRGAEAVNKSWPAFWDTLRGLGAKIDTE